MIMHPFILDCVCIQGQIIPKFYFAFPGAFHRTVLSYYGHQVGKACNFAATYGVEDSLVCAPNYIYPLRQLVSYEQGDI